MFEGLKHRLGRAVVAAIVIVLVAGLAASFPPDLAFLMAVDLSTWVEAALAVYVVAQVAKVRPALIFVRAKVLGRLRRSVRRTRTRAVGKPREASNDDHPARALGFAA